MVTTLTRDHRAVLECGSGLTTIMGGRMAARTGGRWLALESEHRYASVTRRWARLAGAEVEVRVAPLETRGAFEWYQWAGAEGHFDLVVCDGPPGDGVGGRYGALPTLRHDLVPGALILLDDIHRSTEREVLEQWEDEFDVTTEVVEDGHKSFAVITVGTGRSDDPGRGDTTVVDG
jgi:predicted O-methyltransferase YrrM